MVRTARRCKQVEGIQGCVKESEKSSEREKREMAGWGDERAGRRYEMTPAQKLPQEDETTA